jgi:enoyl-CoA hydratase/carnithine racemase
MVERGGAAVNPAAPCYTRRMQKPIVYEERDGIGVLRVNRPEARNALNWEAQDAFAATIAAAARNRTLRVLIITGTGPAFISGGDLRELAESGPGAGERLNRVMTAALAQMAGLPVPVIAAINGDAAGGGCEIIAACDLRLSVPEAQLRFVQVRVGLTTGWGGTARLVRLLGASRAMGLLLPGASISAAEAARIGLVHRLVPAGEPVLDAARAWAAQLATLPRDALAATKELVYAAAGGSAAESAERELFLQLWDRRDHHEAVAAFLEKRSPRFDP